MAKFLIGARFRRPRSNGKREKLGVVYFRIIGKPVSADGVRPERTVNSDIHGADESVIKLERNTIIRQLRLLYCIIEHHDNSCEPFGLDDIVNDFRDALGGSDKMGGIIAKSSVDFPFKSDIVAVGREFKGDFRFVGTQKSKKKEESFAGYILEYSQSLKLSGRNSQSRNFRSLLSSVRSWVKGKDLSFREIDADFIRRYAEWLKQSGIAASTQSFYLRCLRAILNKAQSDGLITVSPKWFADVDTKVYRADGPIDTGLNRDLILKIKNLDLSDDESLSLARDMFMFGFYCGGMELVDIVNLKTENVNRNSLSYRRRLKGKERKIVLGEQALKILQKYHCGGNVHLFPVLDKPCGVLFSSVRNDVSRHIKSIGKLIGFPRLTFGMNIKIYKTMISELNVSEIMMNSI